MNKIEEEARNLAILNNPDQALLDARKACEHWAHGERGDHDLDAFNELVNAFEALDQWLSRGGFLPRDWKSVTPSQRM